MENGKTLKSLREILNVTQKELECENLSRSYIAKIEKGTRNLTKEAAALLAPKLKVIQMKKQIKLDYEITPNLLLGINFDEYNKIIDSLENNLGDFKESMNYLVQIDNILYSCSNDIAHTILQSTLDVLQTKPNKYSRNIKKYADKLIKISKDPTEIVGTHIIIMLAFFRTNNYEAICMIGDTVKNELRFCDKKVAKAFFYNVALAHYESDNYDEALEFIDKANSISINDYKMPIKTLKGNVLIKQEKFDRAEKLYNEILANTSETNSIVNAHINLCDIATKKGNLEKAKYHIQQASKYVDNLNELYHFNFYLNKLILNLKMNLEVYTPFEKVMNAAVKLDDEKKKMRVTKLVTDYYLEINDINQVLRFINVLNKSNINPPYEVVKHLINITENIDDIKNM